MAVITEQEVRQAIEMFNNGMSITKIAKEFLDWLYKDATIFLDRKYQKYLGYAVSRENRKDS